MISTLIRSRDNSTTPPHMGTSEYLVDTTSNRVIYPYTLAENILSKDTNGDIIFPDGSESIFGGSGIDPSTFITHRIDITGTRIPARTSRTWLPYWSPEVADGIYIINVRLIQLSFTSKPDSTGRYKLISLYVGGEEYAVQYSVESNTGYLYATLNAIAKFRKGNPIKLYYENSIDGTARTMAANSCIIYRLIKLCGIS